MHAASPRSASSRKGWPACGRALATPLSPACPCSPHPPLPSDPYGSGVGGQDVYTTFCCPLPHPTTHPCPPPPAPLCPRSDPYGSGVVDQDVYSVLIKNFEESYAGGR